MPLARTCAHCGLGREARGFGDPEGEALHSKSSSLKQPSARGAGAPGSLVLKSWDPPLTPCESHGFAAELGLRSQRTGLSEQSPGSWVAVLLRPQRCHLLCGRNEAVELAILFIQHLPRPCLSCGLQPDDHALWGRDMSGRWGPCPQPLGHKPVCLSFPLLLCPSDHQAPDPLEPTWEPHMAAGIGSRDP